MSEVYKHSAKKAKQAPRQRRTNKLDVRFTDDELAALDRFCGKLDCSRSDAMRWACTHIVRYVCVTHNAEVELLAAECRRIGINVNQMARSMNAAQQRGQLLEYGQAVAELKALEAELASLRDSVDDLRDELNETNREKWMDELDAGWRRYVDD